MKQSRERNSGFELGTLQVLTIILFGALPATVMAPLAAYLMLSAAYQISSNPVPAASGFALGLGGVLGALSAWLAIFRGIRRNNHARLFLVIGIMSGVLAAAAWLGTEPGFHRESLLPLSAITVGIWQVTALARPPALSLAVALGLSLSVYWLSALLA